LAVAPDSAADCDTCSLVRHLDPPSAANGVAWLGLSDPPSGCWNCVGKTTTHSGLQVPNNSLGMRVWNLGTTVSWVGLSWSVDHVGHGDEIHV
jgi:hypothetical protein